jgi:hypothetical protein
MKNELTPPTTKLRLEAAQITIWGLFTALVAVLVTMASL